MEKDVTAYNLSLADREAGAKKRGYDESDEKHAIEATGMGVKKDNTWLYKAGILAGTAALVFGTKICVDKTVTVDQGDCTRTIPLHEEYNNWLAAPLALMAIPARSKDKNQDNIAAQEEFEPEKKEPCPKCPDCPPTQEKNEQEPTKEEERDKVETQTISIPEDTECDYTIKGGKTVKTIKYGGYWHYANLYKDCKTGKPLTKKQLAELTQKLKPGRDGSSIQKDGKNRVLQAEITLNDGTKVCLYEDEKIPEIIARMEKLANGGGKDMKLADKKVGIYDCNGRLVGTASSEQEAKQKINTLKGQQNPVKDASYTLRSAE